MKHQGGHQSPSAGAQPPYPAAHRQLLRAVTELAGADGPRPLTADRVAEHAGVPVETFFAFFGDAESSVVAAHDDWVETGLRRVERPPASGAQPRTPAETTQQIEGLLLDVVGRFYGCLAARPDVARLCLVEAPAVGERGLAARDRAVDRLRRMLDQQLTQLVPEPADALASRLAAGGIYDTAQRYAHTGETDLLPAAVPAVAQTWATVLSGGAGRPA